jgi:glutaredoxin
MKEINIIELFLPGCHNCENFEEFWHSIEKDWPNVKLSKVDTTTPEGQELAQKHQVFVAPGIVINGELWASGGFNKDEYIKKLQELSE